jgi:hypothetical protein
VVRLESPVEGGSRFVLRLPVAAQLLDLQDDAGAAGRPDATTADPGVS